ncbi:hypothetical protein ATO50_02995 [Aeromonas hydrophila]|nr:hypothetical protein ATO50_02995 [Aeromonas hydrophila]
MLLHSIILGSIHAHAIEQTPLESVSGYMERATIFSEYGVCCLRAGRCFFRRYAVAMSCYKFFIGKIYFCLTGNIFWFDLIIDV